MQARIDLPRFAIVTPFPNTGLYKRLETEGRILTKNWELYDGQHAVFRPAKLSVDELQRGTEAAWKHAYSFRSMARRMTHSPAPWPVRLGTNLGYRFYAHHLSRFYNCDWIIGRTTRAAEVSNAPGVEEARNPLALMKRANPATRISAAIAADVTVRRLIGLSPQQPATRSLSCVLRRELCAYREALALPS